jgi:chaperone required for assembly of F1-ATPase
VRRFYQTAEAVEVDGGFGVALDGKNVKTPAHAPWVVPSRAIAEEVAAEWQAQDEIIRPHNMHLFKLVNTGLDLTSPARENLINSLTRYIESDLICYRADEPEDLITLQNEVWGPLLDWFDATYGVRLNTGSGIMPLQQPADTAEKIRAKIEQRNNFEIVALDLAASTAGSLIIGLGLLEKQIDAAAAFEAAQLDEKWQNQKWGEVREVKPRNAAIKIDLEVSRKLIDLLG